MLRFMQALLGFALIAGILGFSGLIPAWGGFARGLFYFYAGVLGVCCAVMLVRQRSG